MNAALRFTPFVRVFCFVFLLIATRHSNGAELKLEIPLDSEVELSLIRLGPELLKRVNVVDQKTGKSWPYYLLRNSGEYSLPVESDEEVVFVAIGAGGGGTSSLRRHDYIRTGASGASGDVAIYKPQIHNLYYIKDDNLIANYRGLHFSTKIGFGGAHGPYIACETRHKTRDYPFNWRASAGAIFNAKSGQDTNIQVKGVDSESTRLFGITATGGGGAFDHYELGAVSTGGETRGFNLKLPPSGGFTSFFGVAGIPGRANARVLVGNTHLIQSPGGRYLNHKFGAGGDGGGYDARIGSILNPPGSSYNGWDKADQCAVHQEAIGQSGEDGVLAIVVQEGLRDDLYPSIGEIQSYFLPQMDANDTNSKATLVELQQSIREFVNFDSTIYDKFPKTVHQLNHGNPSKTLMTFLQENSAFYRKGEMIASIPKLFKGLHDAYKLVPKAKKRLLALLMWASMSHEHDVPEHLDFDKDFAGQKTSDLKSELDSLEKNIDAFQYVLANNLAPHSQDNYRQLRKMKDRYNKLKKEVQKRVEHQEKSRIHKRMGDLGGVAADLPVNQEGQSTSPTYIFPERSPGLTCYSICSHGVAPTELGIQCSASCY